MVLLITCEKYNLYSNNLDDQHYIFYIRYNIIIL